MRQRDGEHSGQAEVIDDWSLVDGPVDEPAAASHFKDSDLLNTDDAEPTSSSSSDDLNVTDDNVLTSLDVGKSQLSMVWKAGCRIFQHKKTKTLHLLPTGPAW